MKQKNKKKRIFGNVITYSLLSVMLTGKGIVRTGHVNKREILKPAIHDHFLSLFKWQFSFFNLNDINIHDHFLLFFNDAFTFENSMKSV